MTDKEAMKLALEALELLTGAWQTFDALDYGDKAIAALKERLAQEKALQALHNENERLGLYKDAYAKPEYSDIVSDGGLDPRNKFDAPPQRTEQEPDYWLGYGLQAYTEKPFEYATALYRHPLQRKPLTVWEIELWAAKPINRVALCRAIEAAHGIKENT